MPSLRQWVLGALGTMALAACAADERGLSFQLEAVGSAGMGASSTGGRGVSAEGGDAGLAGTDAGPDGGGGDESPGAGSSSGGEPSTQGGSASAGGSTGGNGTSGNGTSGNGMGGSSTAGGTGGSGGSGGEPFVSPCGDLNDNRVDDCDETLLQNSRFDTALTGWTADGSLLAQQWAATDARAQTASGSISVSNVNVVAAGTGNTALGSWQCLPAWGNERFEVGARAFIKEGQPAGKASVSLLVFGQDDCGGAPLEGIEVGRTSAPGSWQVIRKTVKMPAASRSARVRLLASKPFAQASLEVLFDDVLVVKAE